MTYMRNDGRQEVVNAAVEPGHSSAYDRTWGGTLNRILKACTGTSFYEVATGACVFAGVEMSSGTTITVTVYNATSASSNALWTRVLSSGAGDGPAGGPVLCPNGLYITFSSTTYNGQVLGVPST